MASANPENAQNPVDEVVVVATALPADVVSVAPVETAQQATLAPAIGTPALV